MKKVFDFIHAEDGAVTVDWVVLTAATVGIGMLVLIPIAYSSSSSAVDVAADIAAQPVGYKR